LAFKEGMLSTPISVLGGWPTVSGRLLHSMEDRTGLGHMTVDTCGKQFLLTFLAMK
jgi:hypothetical protein